MGFIRKSEWISTRRPPGFNVLPGFQSDKRSAPSSGFGSRDSFTGLPPAGGTDELVARIEALGLAQVGLAQERLAAQAVQDAGQEEMLGMTLLAEDGLAFRSQRSASARCSGVSPRARTRAAMAIVQFRSFSASFKPAEMVLRRVKLNAFEHTAAA